MKNRSALLSITVLVVALSGGRAAAHGCDATNLSAVFRNPALYDGMTFCGAAFFDKDLGTFYPRPMAKDDDAKLGVAIQIADGKFQPRSRKLSSLRAGQRVWISGVLDVAKECMNPSNDGSINACVPIAFPIFMHSPLIR